MSSQSTGSKWQPTVIDWSDKEIEAYNAAIDKDEQEMEEREAACSHQLLKRLKMPEDEATIKNRNPSWSEINAARIRSDRFEYDPDKRQDVIAKSLDRAIQKPIEPLKIRKDERIATWARRNEERDAKIRRKYGSAADDSHPSSSSASHVEDPNHQRSEDPASPYILCGSPTGETDDDM
jgi:hypothetical protein